MSNDQITTYKKGFERRTDDIKKDADRARELLVRAGINTSKGNLKKEYRDTK